MREEATIDPLPQAPEEGNEEATVKELVAYRKQHGVSAAHVLGMALRIGYAAGQRHANADAFSAGYDVGVRAAISAYDQADALRAEQQQLEPVGEQS